MRRATIRTYGVKVAGEAATARRRERHRRGKVSASRAGGPARLADDRGRQAAVGRRRRPQARRGHRSLQPRHRAVERTPARRPCTRPIARAGTRSSEVIEEKDVGQCALAILLDECTVHGPVLVPISPPMNALLFPGILIPAGRSTRIRRPEELQSSWQSAFGPILDRSARRNALCQTVGGRARPQILYVLYNPNR